MSDKSNITLPRPTVALIGLGTMGAGIAERLLDQGFAVDVWNRTPGPAARLTERGATAHAMPEQAAASANVVLTMLPTSCWSGTPSTRCTPGRSGRRWEP